MREGRGKEKIKKKIKCDGKRREEERRKKEEKRWKEKKQKKRGKEVGNIKIVFWNVTGLKNKDKKFWEKIGKCDVIVLIET